MTKARAHANIALMKYWGKLDEDLALPYTSSVSLTLDALFTETEVRRDPGLKDDLFVLNGEEQPVAETGKISRFIDLFRQDSGRVRVVTRNSFPTASGLASSASGFAALATALNEEYQLGLDKKELSRLTRRGSGSASRSLFGGLAVWQKGDDKASFAYPLTAMPDMEMLIAVVSADKKKRSSRSLMKQTVQESAYFDAWVKESEREFPRMLEAIEAEDIHAIGRLAERNAMMMHATLLANHEPFFYFQPQTLQILETVQDLRETGLTASYTLDAGPNVKIITDSGSASEILKLLRSNYPGLDVIEAKPGPEARIL